MSWLKEKLMGKKEKIKRITIIMLQTHQCRCTADECAVQITLHKKKWCGITSKIDHACGYRIPPEVDP